MTTADLIPPKHSDRNDCFTFNVLPSFSTLSRGSNSSPTSSTCALCHCLPLESGNVTGKYSCTSDTLLACACTSRYSRSTSAHQLFFFALHHFQLPPAHSAHCRSHQCASRHRATSSYVIPGEKRRVTAFAFALRDSSSHSSAHTVRCIHSRTSRSVTRDSTSASTRPLNCRCLCTAPTATRNNTSGARSCVSST